MKFLANENIPLPSIDFLVESGQDIISIAKKYPGVTDEEVMQLSIDQNRTIITLDSDYGELIFKMGFKPGAGVLYIRLKKYHPSEIGIVVLELIERSIDFNKKLIVVDENTIRERRY